MVEDSGRSPDGSGHSAEPEPVVSALRASVPNAEIVTQRDIIRGIPARFRESYGRDLGGYCWKPGWTKGGILKALDAADVETISAKEVGEIIGNDSWTNLDCDLCGESQTLIIRAGDEPDYEVRWLDICVKCAQGLGELAALATASPLADRQSNP